MPGARGNTAGWGVLRATGGGPVLYSLRDLFATDRAAGAVNGTAAEPGPGTRTVVDTENKLTISGGKLTFAGGKAVPAWGDPGVWYPSVVRAVGRAMLSSITRNAGGSTGMQVGFDNGTSGTLAANCFYCAGTSFAANSNGGSQNVSVATISYGSKYQTALILRSTGAFWFVRGGVEFPGWTLLWPCLDNNSATLYPAVSNNDGVGSVESLRITDLPAPWNSDYGIATQRLAGARSAGDTFIHEADCLIGFTVAALPSAVEIQLTFRRQDANNQWYIVVKPDGSMVVREYVTGTPTVRIGTGPGAVQNGNRVVLIADGNTMRLFANNIAVGTYNAAENFKTCTSGTVSTLGTDGAISDLVSWPRRIGGAALAALNRA